MLRSLCKPDKVTLLQKIKTMFWKTEKKNLKLLSLYTVHGSKLCLNVVVYLTTAFKLLFCCGLHKSLVILIEIVFETFRNGYLEKIVLR